MQSGSCSALKVRSPPCFTAAVVEVLPPELFDFPHADATIATDARTTSSMVNRLCWTTLLGPPCPASTVLASRVIADCGSLQADGQDDRCEREEDRRGDRDA